MSTQNTSSSNKKVLAFYPILTPGHTNVSVSLAKLLLDKYSNQFEVYFIVDLGWETKLAAIDERFKFSSFDLKEHAQGLVKLVDDLEKCLTMSLEDKLKFQWQMLIENPTLIETDRLAEKAIQAINPDFILADQAWHLPSLYSYDYGFICSANPLMFQFEGFPIFNCDALVSEKNKIQKFRDAYREHKSNACDFLRMKFAERGVKFEKNLPIDLIFSENFTVYQFPRELDYYHDDADLLEKNRIWQTDGPLYPGRIPKAFELPKEFKELPQKKIIYVSLGSAFSNYTYLLQKLVDALDKLTAYKFIFSNGFYGDKLIYRSNRFIGSNFVDQLAVLQVVDLAILHGGNNSLCEAIYFGKPVLITPIIGDQINNAVRVKETGFGDSFDVMNFTETELEQKSTDF